MPEKKTLNIDDEALEFPVTIRLGGGPVTLVGRAQRLHDVDLFEPFFVEGDAQGRRSLVFLHMDEEFEVI